jgi:hypothetical protein
MNGERDERRRVLRLLAEGKISPEEAEQILAALAPDAGVEAARASRVSLRCSFCGKSRQEVKRLMAGPGGVYVCNECVGYGQMHIAGIAESMPAALADARQMIPTADGRCSFCGKRRGQAARLFAGPDEIRVCNECLNLCSEIFAREQGEPPPARR